MDQPQNASPAPRRKRDPLLVFVAFPMFNDDMPACTRALYDLVETGKMIGEFTFIRATCKYFSSNMARNVLTAIAHSKDAGVMIMIDADMNLAEHQLLSILRRKEKVVGGLYPRKEVSLTPLWVVNFAVGAKIREDGLCQCVDIGAGALKVDMDVIDDLIERFPETAYSCEQEPWRGETMWDLWSAGVVKEDWRKDGQVWPRYLTDDFYFCWRVRQLGLPIWADTQAQCGHWGGVDFLEVTFMVQQLLEGRQSPAAAGTHSDPTRLNALLPPDAR